MLTSQTRRVLAVAAASIAAATSLLAPAGGNAAPGFDAGAAVRTIAPPSDALETPVGGFGNCHECPTTDIRAGDDITARALYIGSGDGGVLMAKVDTQGWFAGYQQGDRLGITDLRAEVAAELRDRDGLDVGPEDIIVQATHCHACPSIVGIWGETNVDYLRFVYEQTKAALLAAARSARPARISAATADAGFFNDVLLGQANANEGWPIDGQMTVLRATSRDSGAPIATYALVPVHENIVHGPSHDEMSSGYFGAMERELERRIGGIGLAGPATLGDQTSPLQGTAGPFHEDGIDPSRAYVYADRTAALAAAIAVEALEERAHDVGAATVDGAEQYVLVPSTNPALLALNCARPLGEAVGIPIDRSCLPPYAVGPNVGVWFTALRVGDVVIASEPGEAFPHVTFAIQRVFADAALVGVIGQAQDQLGYYYEPTAFPFTFVYSADHHIFNVSLLLAHENVASHALNATELGFEAGPPIISDLSYPLDRLLEASIQIQAYPPAPPAPESVPDAAPGAPADPEARGGRDGITIPIGIFRQAARAGTESDGPAIIDFGDGSEPVEVPRELNVMFIEHTFACPGTYVIDAQMPIADESWTIRARVTDASTVTMAALYPPDAQVHAPPGSDEQAQGAAPSCAPASTTPDPTTTPRGSPSASASPTEPSASPSPAVSGSGTSGGTGGGLPATGASDMRVVGALLLVGALVTSLRRR